MKKILIYLFLSVSTILVISCIVRKATGKEPLSLGYVFQRLKDSDITFNFTDNVRELKDNLYSITHNFENYDGYVFGEIVQGISNIAHNIYYGGKFVLSVIIDTFIAIADIFTLLIDILGYTS